MSDLGTMLKRERLNKDFSIEFVSDHTKISARYIKAIEENDLELFPAELYVEGFIVNLCELYEINPEPLLEERNKALASKKESEPEEKEKEIEDTPPMTWVDIIKQPNFTITAFIVSLILLVGLFAILFIKERDTQTIVMLNNQQTEASTYRLTDEQETYDLKVHDEVDIFFNNEYQKFVIKEISIEKVLFNINSLDYSIGEGDSMEVDLNNDQSSDVEITLNKISGELGIMYFKLINYKNQSTDFQTIWNTQDHVLVGKYHTLLKNQAKAPIEIYVKTQSLPSHLQFNVDGRRQKTVKLETGNERVITAEDHIEIIVGNYKSVVFIINKIPINLVLDNDSYSVTKIIKWIVDPNNETKFDLVIKDYVD